ncbi:universal stress protein [Simplicispira psychrophila]|uniref:universal stress protein n=1 Tax=Simplicispira psychrophila TaxID=80882 RepID=UPI0004820169|nr:universal stress protein [Simplicispira psychrophila]
MYKCILIATDGSPLSDKAVDAGLSLAALTGAAVIALKVVPNYPRSYFEGGLATDANDMKRIEKQWSEAASTLVKAIKSKGDAQNVAVTAVVVKSDLVAESVIETAQNHHCDLIVMASHGRKGIQRMLLGSETQHVLTHANMPVLVLR